MARTKQDEQQNNEATVPQTRVPSIPNPSSTAMATLESLSNIKCVALLEEFCSITRILPPRYQDQAHESRGFTSQVMFGHVEAVFGKQKGPKSLQESRGEAARRALQWIDRLGILPRSGLHYGLAGASPSSQHAYNQSAIGTAGVHHMIPTKINNRPGSTQNPPHSLPWSPPAIDLRTLRQDMHSETRSGFEHGLHQNPRPNSGPGAASSVKKSHRRAQKPAKALRKPKKRPDLTGGPTSSAANTIPLKRRRLPEKPMFSPKKSISPALTRQSLLSRMNLYQEKVHRVAAMCDYLSIAHPEYIMVDENQHGACFAAQFPATEVFLNRVGRIGLTGFIDGTAFLQGRVQGREMCAGKVERFLMEQVENGTFELQEDGEGDAHSANSTVRAREEVTERVKRHRLDHSATHFLDTINDHITRNEATPRASEAAGVTNRPTSSIEAELMRCQETESLIIKLEPVEQHFQTPFVDRKENTAILIKPEPIEQQHDLYKDEHKGVRPSDMRWEAIFRFRSDDEVVKGGAIDGRNAANMEVAAAMKAEMLVEARKGAPVAVKQEVEVLELSN